MRVDNIRGRSLALPTPLPTQHEPPGRPRREEIVIHCRGRICWRHARAFHTIESQAVELPRGYEKVRGIVTRLQRP